MILFDLQNSYHLKSRKKSHKNLISVISFIIFQMVDNQREMARRAKYKSSFTEKRERLALEKRMGVAPTLGPGLNKSESLTKGNRAFEALDAGARDGECNFFRIFSNFIGIFSHYFVLIDSK